MSITDYKATTHLKVLTQFLGKTDGKDKLLATIQYVCLFVSAGEPGNAKKVQASLAAGRKVFRFARPLEVLMPLITDPTFKMDKPIPPQLLAKLKCLCQFIYFGADHWVWGSQAGLVTDKEKVKRFQRASMWGWFGASACQVGVEVYSLAELLLPAKKKVEGEAEDAKAAAARQAEIDRRSLVLFHAFVQGLLALGLLEKLPVKPRTVGTFGIIASAINCYMMYPAYPAPDAAAKPKPLPAPAAALPAAAKPALKTA